MEIRSFIARANFRDRRDLCITLTIPAIGFLAAKLLSNLISAFAAPGIPARPLIHRAPMTRIRRADEEEDIPYPPDALPGGRNIDTPYGNIRAYEWGPESGRKVLFLHGISTPCIALTRVAKLLVRQGCRVLLFDLPGRGYSDCPDPNIYRQDINFFSAQILAVIASSPLNWVSGFTMLGYSLGGGIAAEFASYNPHLIESLVLVAPGGIVRPTRLALASRILYSGLLPDNIVNYYVGERMRVGTKSSQRKVVPVSSLRKGRRASLTTAVHEELPDELDPHAPGQDSVSPIFDDRPCVSPATAVQWQLDVHPGFIPAFISCIKYAPIHDGFERWKLIGRRCEARRAEGAKHCAMRTSHETRASSSSSTSSSYSSSDELDTRVLDEGKVLLVLGTKDVIIMPEETAEDAVAALGKDNVQIVKVPGGHDLVLSNTETCVQAMMEFWDSAPRIDEKWNDLSY